MATEANVYIHGRNGGMTEQEYFDHYNQLDAAEARGDQNECDRIGRLIPITADVAMALKKIYGRDFIIFCGFDVTEATMAFGEGWLDEDDGGDVRINKNVNAEIAKKLVRAASKASQTELKLMQSPEAQLNKKAKEGLTKAIMDATENATSVEDLLYIERMLLALEKGAAANDQDIADIENAERDYAEISESVERMRQSPMEQEDYPPSPETDGSAKNPWPHTN